MTDVVFVVAAYGIVLGGLLLYVASVERRVRAARRVAAALMHARERETADAASAGAESVEKTR